MSLSNPRKVNPATKFIDWSGSKGQFKYYDKKKKENVFFEEDIYIIPLDDLNTIRGFDSDNQCGYYSNEVKYLNKEEMFVKSFKGGQIAKGLYNNLKLPAGCKFSKSVYAAMIIYDEENTSIELVNFQFIGAAVKAWFDAKIKVESGNIIKLSASTELLKKGATEYYAPKILKVGKRNDILNKCVEMDKELQIYLKSYFNQDHSEETEKIAKKEAQEDITKSEEEITAEMYMKESEKVIDDFNDVDDLPF